MVGTGERLDVGEHGLELPAQQPPEHIAVGVSQTPQLVADGVRIARVRHVEAPHLTHVRHGLEERRPLPERPRHLREFPRLELHGFEDGNVRVHVSLEEARVVLAGLHLQGELGDLRRAGVDLKAPEVLPQDQGGDVLGVVALLLVHGEEHVEGVYQDVAAAAGGVENAYVLRAVDVDVGLVVLGGDVVLHPPRQAGAGVVEHPQAPERVLREEAHDVLGREELRGGGYVIRARLALAGEVLVLALGDVELVEPAQNLDRGARLGIHVLHDASEDRPLGEEPLRHEERARGLLGEEVAHGPLVVPAHGTQERGVGVLGCVRAEDGAHEQRRHAVAHHAVEAVGGVEHTLRGVRQDGRQRGALPGRHHGRGVVAVRVHEAECAQAVEPRVCRAVYDLVASALGDGGLQLLHGLRVQEPLGAAFRQDRVEPPPDLAAELLARAGGERPDLARVHGARPF